MLPYPAPLLVAAVCLWAAAGPAQAEGALPGGSPAGANVTVATGAELLAALQGKAQDIRLAGETRCNSEKRGALFGSRQKRCMQLPRSMGGASQPPLACVQATSPSLPRTGRPTSSPFESTATAQCASTQVGLQRFPSSQPAGQPASHQCPRTCGGGHPRTCEGAPTAGANMHS